MAATSSRAAGTGLDLGPGRARERSWTSGRYTRCRLMVPSLMESNRRKRRDGRPGGSSAYRWHGVPADWSRVPDERPLRGECSGRRIVLGVEAAGDEARCPREVEVVHQQVLPAVGNVSQALPLRVDQGRGGLLVAHGVVDAGEVDGVLDAAGDHRLLVVR